MVNSELSVSGPRTPAQLKEHESWNISQKQSIRFPFNHDEMRLLVVIENVLKKIMANSILVKLRKQYVHQTNVVQCID